MLTELQERKLIHYFDILDHNGNGSIEEDDFSGVGENLCVLWDILPGTKEYKKIISSVTQQWTGLLASIGNNNLESATKDEWLDFADRYIVNGEKKDYDVYVKNVVEGIFGMFDQNGDNVISFKEYIDLFMAFRIEIRHSAKSFVNMDVNNDGFISKQELELAVEEFYRSDDPDAKGNWLFGDWERVMSV